MFGVLRLNVLNVFPWRYMLVHVTLGVSGPSPRPSAALDLVFNRVLAPPHRRMREAWRDRIRFRSADADMGLVCEDIMARLGAPDWLLALLPADTLATLTATRRTPRGAKGELIDPVGWNRPALKSLHLPDLTGEPVATALANVLAANTTITRLELPKCDAAVAGAVASLLPTNTTLQYVTVGGGVELPVGALRDGTVTSLELTTPDVGTRGKPSFRVEDVIVLSAALELNSSLRDLHVSGGVLSKVSAAAVSSACQQ
jgi:hypothetical protein